MSGLAHATIERLRLVSTATLTTQLFKRGLRNAFMQGVRPLARYEGNLVGPAFTLRNIPAREDVDTVAVFGNPEHPQRKAIEITPVGHVLVIDCRGDTRAACAGEILVTRLMKRGVAGLVGDGGIRDAGADRRDGAISGVLRGSKCTSEPRPPSRGGKQRADRLRWRRGVSRRHRRGGSRRRGCHSARHGGRDRGRFDGAGATRGVSARACGRWRCSVRHLSAERGDADCLRDLAKGPTARLRSPHSHGGTTTRKADSARNFRDRCGVPWSQPVEELQ